MSGSKLISAMCNPQPDDAAYSDQALSRRGHPISCRREGAWGGVERVLVRPRVVSVL